MGWRPVAAAIVLVLTGCTGPGSSEVSSPRPTGSVPDGATSAASADSGSPGPTTPNPSSASPASPRPKPKPKPPHPISIAALTQLRYDGHGLKRGRLLGDAGPYKRYLASYRGDGLRISGVMFVPDGKGPFPVVVTNHGYINPETYFPGQGMPREEDHLARRGYVVLHVDYRGHASSDDDPNVDYELRLPYAVDAINAVKAIKSSTLPYLDGERVGYLGRSMGGGVTMTALVAQPNLVDAAVIYDSVSSLAADNWRRWSQDAADQATNRRIKRTYGLPDKSPAFWRAASARSAFTRIRDPLLVIHGEQDRTCPPTWAKATVAALRAADRDVTYVTYPGADHTFEGRTWQRSIERTTAYLDRHLR